MKCMFLRTKTDGILSKSKSRRCVTYFCKSAKLFLSVYLVEYNFWRTRTVDFSSSRWVFKFLSAISLPQKINGNSSFCKAQGSLSLSSALSQNFHRMTTIFATK